MLSALQAFLSGMVRIPFGGSIWALSHYYQAEVNCLQLKPRRNTMAQHITTERPREGVALITMNNPAINNHGSWIAIGQLAAAIKEAREHGARVAGVWGGGCGHSLA